MINQLSERFRSPALFWSVLFAATWLLSAYSFQLYKALGARWIIKFPSAWEWKLDNRISSFMSWLVEDASFGLFTFRELTRFFSALIEVPYDAVRALLADGFNSGVGQQAVEVLPSLSWIAVTLLLTLLALRVGGRRLALLVAGCFLYLAVFGQWQSAMVTLASIAIAVPFGVFGGLALGILATSLRVLSDFCDQFWILCRRFPSSLIWCPSCSCLALGRFLRWSQLSSMQCRRWCVLCWLLFNLCQRSFMKLGRCLGVHLAR